MYALVAKMQSYHLDKRGHTRIPIRRISYEPPCAILGALQGHRCLGAIIQAAVIRKIKYSRIWLTRLIEEEEDGKGGKERIKKRDDVWIRSRTDDHRIFLIFLKSETRVLRNRTHMYVVDAISSKRAFINYPD